MKFRLRATCAALALAATSVGAADAQNPDAFVLPPGMFRLSVEGTHASYESVFDASGTSVPLATGLAGELTPGRFAALRPLATQLTDFFAATNGNAVDPGGISLGTLDAQAAATWTQGVARLAVGLFPRFEIGASLPLIRSDRTIQRLGLAGGTVGVNPSPTANAAILARIGWGPLGASGLLPTAESPAGIELQSRVTALAGEPLSLPADTADAEVLQSLLAEAYGLPPLTSRVDPYRIGDVEVYGRLLLLSSFGRAPFPSDSAPAGLRVSLTGGARLPTGTEPDSLPLLAPPPDTRLSSYFGGVAADLFLGPRLWLSGAARINRNLGSDVTRRLAPADSPLSVTDPPQVVTLRRGGSLEIAVAPRFRLAESIWLAAEYSGVMVGDTEYSLAGSGDGAAVLSLAGGGLHRAGVGIRYSSLAAYWAGRASLPADIALTYLRTISGPEGAPAGGAVTVTASLLPQLWSRRR
ncbi:MAG TPA: hypothetical protein VFZ18_03930 [Longimicrobiaceae bacterium]